jgi:hypothetical protein
MTSKTLMLDLVKAFDWPAVERALAEHLLKLGCDREHCLWAAVFRRDREAIRLPPPTSCAARRTRPFIAWPTG